MSEIDDVKVDQNTDNHAEYNQVLLNNSVDPDSEDKDHIEIMPDNNNNSIDCILFLHIGRRIRRSEWIRISS